MSLRNPFAELAGMVLGKSDLQSIFCLLVFCIVTLVLAYLTNPTENSFRTYLTEQSFRHHLSRLEDCLDSEQGVHDGLSSRSFHSACFSRSMKTPTTDRNGPFHFANRASISLRTPKHVFHSFAVFTIAAMVPVQKGNAVSDEADGWSISDSWYIGAFGKWWRGGVWETWYQDVIARSKDEEGWSSGILSMKNLDMLPDFHAGSYMPKTLPFHLLTKQSPPRLRNRDQPVHKSTPPRSSSPPPLSKTASLPLHSKRLPNAPAERCDYLSAPTSCLPMAPVVPHGKTTRSTLFDQSPLIAEVLRQITASTASVKELRTQYSDFQASASQSHEILNLELESHRERKRLEDASRLELKTKTKNLDDQKRTAEQLKREAGRKLKASRTTRDSTLHRIEFLDREVATLTERTNNDREIIAQKSAEAPEVEVELSQALECKRSEIKAAEEALLTLNRRSRELEEKLAMERERLESLKEKVGRRMKEHASSATYQGHPMVDNVNEASFNRRLPAIDTSHPYPIHDQPPTFNSDSSSSPVHPDAVHAPLHHYGLYPEDAFLAESPIYEEGYGHKDLEMSPATRRTHYSSIGQVPSDQPSEISKALQLENDPTFNQSWNSSPLYSLSSTNSTPTTSLFSSIAESQRDGVSLSYDSLNDFSAIDSSISNYPWSPDSSMVDDLGYLRDQHLSGKHATTGGRPKKGLNPGAKVFSLPRKLAPSGPQTMHSAPVTYDALNPNGLVSTMLPSASSNNSSLLRAFAPSRAEREALQRALGGSTNSSLERLPSLSEVGSIPSSPSHVHASPLNINLSQRTKDSAASSKTFNLPSWLTALPNIRKSRFKPWDDDEPVSTGIGEESVSQRA